MPPQAHRGLRPQEPLRADLQSLDPRRGDRLCSKQQQGQRLGVHKCGRLQIEPGDCGFRVGDVRGNFAVQGDPVPDQQIRHVRFVLARLPVAA